MSSELARIEPLEIPDLGRLPVESRAIVGQLIVAFAAQTQRALEAVKLELRAVVNDNSVLRENLAVLNKAMGEFQERQAIPIRDALLDFNENTAGRVIENQRNLETMLQALARQMERANIPLPADAAESIAVGRFEEKEHAVATDAGGAPRAPGAGLTEFTDDTKGYA